MRRIPAGPVPAPRPADEAARLRRLAELSILDTAPEQIFDDIAKLAGLICGTPIALVSLVDEHRQWFKARVGLEAQETPRDVAFCAHAILAPEQVMVVADARADDRFAGNPLVTGEPGIRFYSGAPIVAADGQALGTVCAIDREPRAMTPAQESALQALARQAGRLLEWRQAVQHKQDRLQDEVQRHHARAEQAAALAAQTLDLQSFVDRDHVYRYVNDRYCEYSGRSAAEVEGRSVAELLGEAAYRERVEPLLRRAMAGERVDHEAAFHFPGRGKRHMEVTYLPARIDGEVVGVVVRAHDVHDLKEAQLNLASAVEDLNRRHAMQQQFIYMLSHDLREPINTICNFTGLLAESHGASLDAKAARHLRFVREGGERMRRLLDDLLAYVRLDRAAPQPEPVPLDAVLQDVRDDLAHAIQASGARIEVAPLPAVLGDATTLRVLFQNLLANAIKFHEPDAAPEIDVTARVQAGFVAVTVRDRGIGIPLAQQAQLFGVFKRLHLRHEFDGTGLGLATCKRIVELHHGTIAVESTPGLGSAFTVRMPAAARDAEGAQA